MAVNTQLVSLVNEFFKSVNRQHSNVISTLDHKKGVIGHEECKSHINSIVQLVIDFKEKFKPIQSSICDSQGNSSNVTSRSSSNSQDNTAVKQVNVNDNLNERVDALEKLC